MFSKIGQYAKRNVVIILIVSISTALRTLIVFNGGKSLFDTGQDAPTYLDAAMDFHKFGWFSDQIRSLPTWPAGYPFFISLFIVLSASTWWLWVVVFQHLLYVIAVLFFTHGLSFILKKRERVSLLALLLFMPSFLYSPSENMYESVVAASLMLGISGAIHLMFSDRRTTTWYLVLISIFFFGFAGFLQAKTAPIGLIVLVIVGYLKNRKILFMAPLALWGVALTVHRSFVAYGILSPSTNFGIAIKVSGAQIPCSIKDAANLSPQQISAASDQQFVICAIKNFASHPLDLLTQVVQQGRALFGPLDGAGVPGSSTWFHGLGFTRISDMFGFSNTKILFEIENIYSLALNFAILLGFIIAIKTYKKWSIIILTLPVLIISSVHLISDGDSRYRLPFLPFQMVFVVIFCWHAISTLNRARKPVSTL